MSRESMLRGTSRPIKTNKMEIELSCGSEIDDRNSQYGENLSPGVKFTEVPEDGKSLVLFMENLNASESRGVHWVIWNIPPDKDLPEGVERKERPSEVPGAVQGNNSYHVIGYEGPKYPPGGETYRFTAYALDQKLRLSPGSSMENVRQAMKETVLEKASTESGYTN
jgi:Raf kinase inhibitor-like YbhB/YbcL family protein